jgi:hypothetical protein
MDLLASHDFIGSLMVMSPCRVEPGVFVDGRCEVKVYGPFRSEHRPPRFDIELIFDYLVWVFDARTGNILTGGRHQWNDMTGYPSHEFDSYLEGLETPRRYRPASAGSTREERED